MKTTLNIEVSGIVAARDREPYVQVLKNGELVAQFTVAEARSIAQDIIVAASHAEADAMIGRFFGKMQFPEEAWAALLVEFRAFRWEQEQKGVETFRSSPDGEKGQSNA